ncbi:MAG TPA: DCC1-like thiol-disulfide oxidoreductase family protein [Candidatus Nanopelagicales bacterium]|jgi:predicted DCC family thiol-disulfide oxidoreductase YuxK|nr:DCC1-like thiol-disulfide oxidoreductase family protein [Candidatus Nanopelagicales bacterium]
MTRPAGGSTLPLLVFDGDCAFCTASIDWLARTFPGAFDTVPYQRADLRSLGLTAQECHARLQWLTDPSRSADQEGTSRSGAPAVAAVLRTGGRRRGGIVGAAARGIGAAASCPPLSWLAAAGYAVVAANRSRLPGGTPACAL